MLEYKISSPEDMKTLGYLLGKMYRETGLGQYIVLSGDLGSGKTTLTQGIGLGLNIQKPIKSPSYPIIREYQKTEFPLFHMDFYRLEDDDTLYELGIEEYYDQKGMSVIEWGMLFPEYLPEHFFHIHIEVTEDQYRKVTIQESIPTESLSRIQDYLNHQEFLR